MPTESLALTDPNTPHYYLLSATAQSLATIMTLVFTVTLVVAQLTTTYGMHLAESAFGWRNISKMLVFMVATAFSLAGVLFPCLPTSLISIALTLVCMGVLVQHFRSMKSELSIEAAIERLRQQAVLAIGARRKDDFGTQLDRLETIAYQALSKYDYVNAGAAITSMAYLAGALESADWRDDALEMKERIKRMALEVREHPKGVSVVLEGLVRGITRAGSAATEMMRDQIVDTVVAVIRACAWPREEEIVASAFEGAGRLLTGLVMETNPDLGGATAYVMNRMTDEWKHLTSTSSGRDHGRGRAATVLHGTYCKLARACVDRTRPDEGCINAAVAHALELQANEHGEGTFGPSSGFALRRMTDTLVATARFLKPGPVLTPLENVSTAYNGWSFRAMVHWQDVLEAMLDGGDPSLVNVVLGKVTGAMAAVVDRRYSDHVRAIVVALGNRAGPLVHALGIHDYGATQSLFTVATNKMSAGLVDRSDLARCILSFAVTQFATGSPNRIAEKLLTVSDTLVGKFEDGATSDIEPDVAFCWFLSAALRFKQHEHRGASTRLAAVHDLSANDAKRAALEHWAADVWGRASQSVKEALPDLRDLYRKLGFSVPDVGK